MNAGEPQPLLHIMGPPPRTMITFRPLSAPSPCDGSESGAAMGLRWLARLAVGGLIGPRHAKGQAVELARLRRALARAQAESAGRPPRSRLPVAITRMTFEALADALRADAAEVPLASLGLPAFGLLLPARDAARPHERSVRLTLAVLARRRGSVFLRDAAPLAPASFDGPALDLWAPVLPVGEGAQP
jgi:hypothetical protein